jgi:hypothetical protein
MASLLDLSEQQPDPLGQVYQAVTDHTEERNRGWLSSIAGLLGIGGPPATESIPGKRLTHYPDQNDIANARQSDFSYGSGNEAFSSGRTANLLGIPATDRYVDELTAPSAARGAPGTPQTADAYEAAQLAINRSPIAALGYDPRRINLDTASGPNTTVIGAYSRENDASYSNAAYPSNLVHESVHRGLERLRQANIVPPELWAKLPKDEEKTTRYIMALHMGDPEKGRGPAGDADRARALRVFGKKENDPQAYAFSSGAEDRQALEDLNAIASRYLLSLHPGGPR